MGSPVASAKAAQVDAHPPPEGETWRKKKAVPKDGPYRSDKDQKHPVVCRMALRAQLRSRRVGPQSWSLRCLYCKNNVQQQGNLVLRIQIRKRLLGKNLDFLKILTLSRRILCGQHDVREPASAVVPARLKKSRPSNVKNEMRRGVSVVLKRDNRSTERNDLRVKEIEALLGEPLAHHADRLPDLDNLVALRDGCQLEQMGERMSFADATVKLVPAEGRRFHHVVDPLFDFVVRARNSPA